MFSIKNYKNKIRRLGIGTVFSDNVSEFYMVCRSRTQ